MKLSEKCKNNLKAFGIIYGVGEALSLIDNYEFEADDFQSIVVLTVEEAKQVQQEFLDIVCEIVRTFGYHGVKFVKPASLIMLEERIEQAEGQNESSN